MESTLLKAIHENKPSVDILADKEFPWLIGISEGGSEWTIIENSMEKPKQGKINFNILLGDSTLLTDKKNKSLLELAMRYAEVYKVHAPNSCIKTFQTRMNGLFRFLFWITSKNINRLDQVTKPHINQFIQESVYGQEIVLAIPKKLYMAIKNTLSKTGDFHELPVINGKIARTRYLIDTHIYNSAINNGLFSKRIFDYIDDELLRKKTPHGKILEKSYDELLEHLELYPVRQTVASIHRMLLPIEEIYDWRHFIEGKNFQFNPFPHGSSKVASRYGIATKRTPSIPAKVGFSYLQECTRWVNDYSDQIIDILENNYSADEASEIIKSLGLKFRINERIDPYVSAKFGVVSKEGLLRLLVTASFAVISVLTARRKEEILALEKGFYDKGFLKVWIEKTSQRYDHQPVPPLVGKALEILEIISDNARDLYSIDSLFVYANSENELVEYDPGLYLTKLYEMTVKEEVGIEWSFASHQFRRLFALLYYYRWDDAAIGILSYHLRHFNIEMTKRYITDNEFAKEMREVGGEWTASFLREVTLGKTPIGGKAGNKIKKKLNDWAGEFRSKIDVIEKERVVAKMLRYMDRVGANFTQQVWGTICTCPTKTGLAKNAACTTNNNQPDYASANEEACGGCPFACYTERFKPAIETSIQKEKNNLIASPEGTIWHEKTKIKLVNLQDLLVKTESVEPLLL